MPRASLAALFISVWLTLGVGLAQPSRSELEQQITVYQNILSARQEQLNALAAELSATNTELDAELSERDRLAARVLALGEQQGRIRSQVRVLRRQQRASVARIARLETQAAGLEGQLQDLIVNLHKRRSSRYAGVLAESESMFELRVRNNYLARLAQQDVTLLETFNRTTLDLERARTARAQQVRALDARAGELRANRQALETTQNELEGVIATLSETRVGQLAQREALLQEQGSIEGELTDARSALAAELERLREEAARQASRAEAEPELPVDDAFADRAARLERLIRGLGDPTPTPEQDFASPFPDAVVVRPYGQDGATDIWLRARQPGTAVRAIKSGVVYRDSQITANSGYTVAIRHGSDLISAYTNLQPPVVAIGDRVQQGDILGYLGGGIVAADILQLRVGRPQGFDIIYRDPAPLLELR